MVFFRQKKAQIKISNRILLSFCLCSIPYYNISFTMGQFKALLYKNWILYKRGIIGNVLEILIPFLFVIFVAMIRKLASITYYPEQSFLSNTTYTGTITGDPAAGGWSYPKQCSPSSVVAVMPSGDPLITALISKLTAVGYTVQPYASESQMETYIRSSSYVSGYICFGITVDSSSNDYRYKLRYNISTVGGDGPSTSFSLTRDSGLYLSLYNTTLTRGMMGATTTMNTLILQKETTTTNTFVNTVSPPYQQEYTDDPIYTYIGASIGMLTLLPLLIIYLRQTASMLAQKQTKIRESMNIMGMTLKNYYGTWFIRYFIVMTVTHLLCSIVLARTLSYVPFYIPFITFVLFDIVLIVQNFFIQIFFTRAKLGVVIALLFFIIQFVLSFLVTNSDNPTLQVNTAISIIPHVAFIQAFITMIYAESVQTTVTFAILLNNYKIGIALASFILNIVFYGIITWYLDQVVPNEWGAKKHPCFCCVSGENQGNSRVMDDSTELPEHAAEIEPVDENCKILEREMKMIKIHKLKKTFNDGEITAVNNLSLNMYPSQIFSLLGHNGAGKTTTISMLTGMLSPTSGSISMYGKTELADMRDMIGVCPQHDTLYEQLTVEEHIELFATFKGLEGDLRDAEVQKLIADVNLGQKKEEYAKNLSGGQKRRLSVALAFAGGSKIIILDEPTSGMDTSARRYIWELLKNYKSERIIILTTHFMDQADYLGDRIGIMGNGNLLCCGSSLFLKNKFGVGYNLTFVKADSQTNSQAIIQVVRKYVPSAKLITDVSAEVAMQLPLDQVDKFAKMFEQIDSKLKELRIASYGVSVTTLEEVYLRVGQIMKEDQAKQKKSNVGSQQISIKLKTVKEIGKGDKEMDSMERVKNPQQKDDKDDKTQFDSDSIPKIESSSSIFFLHCKATFLKRFRVIRRDLKSFIFELALPMLIIVLALLLMRISFITDLSAQTINTSLYLSEQNPVLLPIGSSDNTLLTNANTQISNKYGSIVNVSADSTDTTAANFDYNYLFPLKKSIKTLKGGIFFTPPTTGGGYTSYGFTTLTNTKSPTSFFYLQTLAAQTLINSYFSKSISISVVNYPLPRTYSQLQINNTISGFFGAFVFAIALAFKFASIIAFIVKEREDKSKHQQIVSGMRLSAYWIANFVYDYILYAILAIFAVVLCILLSVSSLTGDSLGATWALFMLYGLAYIPFTYIVAYLFKDYGNAQAGFYFFTFVTGGLLPILTFVLRILGTGTSSVGRGIAWVLRILPSFSFGEGLMNLGSKSLYKTYQNGGVAYSSWALQISLAPVIYMVVFGVLYFALVFIIEAAQNSESFMRYFTSEAKITQTQPVTDTDVEAEIQRANKADPSQYEILTKSLRKVYMIDGPKKHKVAVDNLSFGIKKGEVFGLLGINGAGKTTTFKMLAGQITSTSGDSFFRGLKISENIDKIRQGLGYCPQFDALIDNLTVREQLQLFYDLKSLSSEHKDEVITKKIKEMNLDEYDDKLSGTLSGGNKRKLSVAMAMIGNPSIIFLDEPSTGMDPQARRFMWKIISRVSSQKKQATIILTTHSMEEAQALATRLGIMVKGNFKCIGTPQHIKNKYGEGFQIQVKINTILKGQVQEVIAKKNLANTKTVKFQDFDLFLTLLQADPEDRMQLTQKGSGSFLFNYLKQNKKIQIYPIIEFLLINQQTRTILAEMRNKLGETEIIQSLQTFMRLKLKGKISISKIFDFFQTGKRRLNIQQYTIKQATVEQIFNKFAQGDELTEYNG